MATLNVNEQTVDIGRIFLDFNNPRHEPYDDQTEVIEYLCEKENVYALAKDIAKHNLNPLERFGLISLNKNEPHSKKSRYVMAEGNRRLCAIMLLNDPNLAPAKLRGDFEKLARDFKKIDEVPATIFQDKITANFWIERIHNGPQGGIGRKDWNADQKDRHFGGKKYGLATRILNYAQDNGIISADERKGTISTVQRYVGNQKIQDAMGIDISDSKNLFRSISKKDFDIIIKKFVKDLLSNHVSSRANSKVIEKYAIELGKTKGLSKRRVPATLIPAEKKPSKPSKQPKKPKHPETIECEDDILNKLKAKKFYKLEKIYYSLCKIKLKDHTPLLTVGAWSFLESLTACAGRTSGDFLSFLDNNKLQNVFGVKKQDAKAKREAIERISKNGNTTKHSGSAANFNGDQLAHDFDELKEVISSLVDLAKK